jgi:hypothetical protein
MAATENTILIKNVRIFDGTSDKLISGKDILLKGSRVDLLIDGRPWQSKAVGKMDPDKPAWC